MIEMAHEPGGTAATRLRQAAVDLEAGNLLLKQVAAERDGEGN